MLLIPKHAFSPDLMVGDIGHVKVTNSTRYTLFHIMIILIPSLVLKATHTIMYMYLLEQVLGWFLRLGLVVEDKFDDIMIAQF